MSRRPVAVLLAALLLAAGCTTSGQGSADTSTGAPPSSPAPTTPAGSSAATSSAPASSGATTTPAATSIPLTGMRVSDLSFVGDEGWALGTAGCAHSSGRCPVLARTGDGGRTWRSLSVPPAHVQHVRFATPDVGYLFGPSAFYVTGNGGHSWRRQAGGADALESLSGNVIRIVDQGGCPPGCTYTVELAGIGSAQWQRVSLPAPATTSTGVALARTGSRAVLLVLGHPAGGAQDARSTLYASADDGRHWTRHGEPCPQSGGHEVDSVALTSAPDGSFTVLCRSRSAGGAQFVAVSTDGGAHFTAGNRTALGAATVGALGAASARIVLVSSDDTYRSTDGGQHFSRLGANGGSSPGPLGWLGFASPTLAHAISLDGRTIWLTTDGGQAWQRARLN